MPVSRIWRAPLHQEMRETSLTPITASGGRPSLATSGKEQAASNAFIQPRSAYNGHAERHIDGYVASEADLAAPTRDAAAE